MFSYDVYLITVDPRNSAGTVTCSSRSGSTTSTRDVTFTATPNADCGWGFVGWQFGIYPYGQNSWTVTSDTDTYVLHLDGKLPGTSTTYSQLSIHATAYFVHNGTGKLVRYSQQQAKLVRVGDKLLIDN